MSWEEAWYYFVVLLGRRKHQSPWEQLWARLDCGGMWECFYEKHKEN